ncbi:MAG: Asp-tRNA(Asn)/Glu-tRNA(Gln) amidotransferase subunit GatC [Dictyoglomus sp.]|nr:Asp-tRNA(Asn)/Glu-tRNA(Gln) amidotransferase subunit GatC [Dictyoglomus sp.]MCX7941887.1 Asp-tRNA(Asn)/Glu-tRNA(Gln) amidotransferase subunit GatC [Dictyoglomaceae bacterium]MDW8188578.1 Asp-tRNA(Asn)/Glu-tRNA(Gln) amidotransferase subunit GatC [Dictyoglomus sp.]
MIRDFIQQLKKTAHLARLNLTEEEEELYSKQLEEILNYFQKLQELDTSNVEPMAHVLPLNNVWRDDVVKESMEQELILKNAPEVENNCFKVPKIVKNI